MYSINEMASGYKIIDAVNEVQHPVDYEKNMRENILKLSVQILKK